MSREVWNWPKFQRIAAEFPTSGELARGNRKAYVCGRKNRWLDRFYGPRDGSNPRRRRRDAGKPRSKALDGAVTTR